METPTHLSHKPIVHVKNYNEKDAQFSNNTDAQSLSIGFAQWDKHLEIKDRDISVKVWRHNKEHGKWSRHSEELPMHRVIDLSILLIASLIKDEKVHSSDSILGETIIDSEKENFKYIYKYYQEHKCKREIDKKIVELERLIKKFIKNENIKSL